MLLSTVTTHTRTPSAQETRAGRVGSEASLGFLTRSSRRDGVRRLRRRKARARPRLQPPTPQKVVAVEGRETRTLREKSSCPDTLPSPGPSLWSPAAPRSSPLTHNLLVVLPPALGPLLVVHHHASKFPLMLPSLVPHRAEASTWGGDARRVRGAARTTLVAVQSSDKLVMILMLNPKCPGFRGREALPQSWRQSAPADSSQPCGRSSRTMRKRSVTSSVKPSPGRERILGSLP